MNIIATDVTPMTANPPTTPPTMGPTGVDALEEDGDGVAVVVEDEEGFDVVELAAPELDAEALDPFKYVINSVDTYICVMIVGTRE